jgi:hypothetical protein
MQVEWNLSAALVPTVNPTQLNATQLNFILFYSILSIQFPHLYVQYECLLGPALPHSAHGLGHRGVFVHGWATRIVEELWEERDGSIGTVTAKNIFMWWVRSQVTVEAGIGLDRIG